MRKFVLVSLILFFIFSQFQSVFAENWVEVQKYGGDGLLQVDSEPFRVDHINWRIRWEIESTYNGSDIGIEKFSFDVKLHFENRTVASVTPTTRENGTLNFNWVSGKYYLSFPALIPKYTVIVEQNIDSIPEFPSWTLLLISLVVVVVFVVVYRRKLENQVRLKK
jgi:hypothetical protein